MPASGGASAVPRLGTVDRRVVVGVHVLPRRSHRRGSRGDTDGVRADPERPAQPALPLRHSPAPDPLLELDAVDQAPDETRCQVPGQERGDPRVRVQLAQLLRSRLLSHTAIVHHDGRGGVIQTG
jgi:hypothetical protein